MSVDDASGYAKGRRTRAQIVAAALDAFGSAGYRGASMAQIAQTCGVSRAGLAHHFPTKESLLIAVLVERDRVNGELFFAGMDPDGDGGDYLRRLLRVVEHNASTPGIVSLFVTLSAEATDPAHPAHVYFAVRYDTLRRHIHAALTDLRARGLLRGDGADAEVDLIALIDGLQIQWLLAPETVDMPTRMRRWIARETLLTID